MMTRTGRSGLFQVLCASLVLAVALVPQPAAAQAVTGTILGTVRDTSGGALPGATVTVVNSGTGYTRTFTTDAQGEYTAPMVPTGTYTVTAEMGGFKKISIANVQVGVDQKVRTDLKLELGQITEAVTIQAEAPLIQTNSSELGTTVGKEEIEALPLNGRNFVSLTRTIPGVLRPPPGANIDGAGSLAWRAGSGFSANGHRPRDNNYLLDGVDNNETWLQTVVLFPSPDALDEFKMQTSTYAAEFGKSLGGVVNLQIKSGSNQVHGNVFEFARNDAFDANNFFNNKNGRPKPDYKQNQFGATLGGPIIKDRTFFFADYQGLRINQGQTYVSTVPTAKMRAGDFSEINRVIYDPLNPGTPFAGNIIPSNRLDPVALNILKQLYPEANAAGTRGSTGQTINNYVINPELNRQDNQFDVKLDHNVSSNNRAFVRYSFQKTHRFLPATLPHGDSGVTFGAGDGNIKAQGLAFNDTHSFSNNLLNEFRFGWNSIKFFMTPIDYLQNPAAAVGIPGINLNDSTSGMTQLNFDNIRNLGANSNQPLITNQNDFQVFDSVTKVSGKHTMKAGGSITFRSREILNADTIVGNFRYNANLTSNCAGVVTACTLNSATGFDVASFMLGYAATKTRNLFDAKTYTEKRPEYALYVQDDLRASSKLTLNMGLRWDLFVPWVEVDDRQSNFDVSTGKFVVASPDAVVDGIKVGRYLQTYSKKDFGPRFGFAYDASGNGRLVLRGGVGVFWNFTPGGTSSSKAQNPPFLQSTALTSSFLPTLKTSDGLPPPPGVDPNRPAAGTTRSAFDVNFRDAYSTNFNLNVQKQLGRNYMIEIAYVGSRGRQMALKVNENQAPPVLGVRSADINRPFIGVSPQLRDVGALSPTGFLDYNALLVKFQRRFANGFSFMNSYTYGQAIDLNSDNDGGVVLTNTYDPAYNRGPADYDIKHTFVSSWVYALPFAKNKALGGWQFGGILYARTGRALTITQSQAVLSTGTNAGQQQSQRPNRLADNINNSDQTIDHWFDPAAFQIVPEPTATFGTAGRNIARGPGYFNIDVNLVKFTHFGKVENELRIEAFNVLNHPAFADPNTTFGSAAFGTITSMLTNPACSLCGTTERQIQLSIKFKF